MRLIWFPNWSCQNYSPGVSFGAKCPYCPYGLAGGRLLFEGRPAGSNRPCPVEAVVAFLAANRETLGGFVEMSGGEPLLYSTPRWSRC